MKRGFTPGKPYPEMESWPDNSCYVHDATSLVATLIDPSIFVGCLPIIQMPRCIFVAAGCGNNQCIALD